MNFYRVSRGFQHVKDCLTAAKALRVIEGDRNEPAWRIETLDVATMYPHFDREDLEAIRTDPQYSTLDFNQLWAGRAQEGE